MLADTRKSFFWTSAEYLFYAFFLTFPFVYYTSFLYSGTSTRSLTLIVFACALGFGLAAWLCTKRASVRVVKSPLTIALGVYFLTLTISGFFGLSFSTTFWSAATRMTGLWYFLAFGIFLALLWVLVADEKRHHRLILAILVSSAAYSFLDLLSIEGFNLLGDNSYDAYTFGNSTFAAMYLFGAFLLSLYYIAQSERRRWWMYALPAFILINPNIISPGLWLGDFSGGLVGDARATTYSLILSLVALAGLWIVSKIKDTRRRAQASYALFGVGAVVIVVAALSLLVPGGFVREAYLSQATAARPIVWEISQRAIAERPLLGWGADNFERVFEKKYDNRLLQGEYGGEAWFDRAHNVIIDQLVDNGVVGLLAYAAVYVVIILALIYTALKSAAARDRIFASILIVYFAFHIAELQTAFDSSISYPMLGFMFVSAGVLYHRARSAEKENLVVELPHVARYVAGGALVAFCAWSLLMGALPLAKAQIANGAIRDVGFAEERIPLYPALFGSSVDKHAFLWRTATDFQRGIGENPAVLEDAQAVEFLKEEMAIFEEGYREYVEENPKHFRAHLNLADTLIYQRLLGIDKLKEAQAVLDRAIELVPQSPQPYWMKAVAYIYMREFALARESAQKGLALNPNIELSQDVVEYVERSIKTFPDIDLFFFRQI